MADVLACEYVSSGYISGKIANHVLVMCSLAAAVQGMDETVNNGAQAFYLKVIKHTPLLEELGS